jgi:tRNA(Ile)-lysidine synthase
VNLQRLEAEIVAGWPIDEWRDVNVVLAVSGGADSVALLRAFWAIKEQARGRGQLIVGHFHHGLRGAAADADHDWVQRLALQLGVEVYCGHAGDLQLQSGGDGLEAAARKSRYEFLSQLAVESGARYVATGHTADDQVETVLHHILRGTGLAGLAGMPRHRPLMPTVSLIRPMLGVFRAEVLNYLRELKQDYRTDATNEDIKFTRNRVRLELLPALRSVRREADAALLRLASQASEAQVWISNEARRIADQCLRADSGNELLVDLRPLAQASPFQVREVFKSIWEQAGWPRQEMGYPEWEKLANLVISQAETTIVHLPGGVRAVRERDSVRLGRDPSLS